MIQEVVNLICVHLEQLMTNGLVNKNRYNRVLLSNNENKISQSLALVYDSITFPNNICPINYSVLAIKDSSIFDKIAITLKLTDEWCSLKQIKKLHETELELFEKLLIHHNKKIYLMVTDFHKVYEEEFNLEQSNRILEELAEIVNSLNGLFFCVICGNTILNDLLFASLPQDQKHLYPNYTQRDMNNTKLRVFLLE